MNVYAYMWAKCTHIGDLHVNGDRKYVKCDFEGQDSKVYGVPFFIDDDHPISRLKEGCSYLISFDPVDSRNVDVFGPPKSAFLEE